MTRLRISDDRGFAMVEAIVAAMLLVMVALGVLKGLDTAQQSSGREKARSTAAALTEQDQERLRSFRAVDLANYDETRDDHRQQRRLHRPVAGRLGPRLDRRHAELQQQRDPGRLHADHLDHDVEPGQHPDRADHAVEPRRPARRRLRHQPGHARHPGQRPRRRRRRRTSASRSPGRPPSPTRRTPRAARSSPTSRSAPTPRRSTPPAGSTRAATRTPRVGATVSNGTVNVKTLDYDQAASVDATFDTETLGGATVPATTTQLSAANAGVPSGPLAPFAGERVWDPTGGALGTITATGLFPFADGYSLYGGGCPGADPTKNDPDYYTTFGAQRGRRGRSRPRRPGGQGPPPLDQPARLYARPPASRAARVTYMPYTRIVVTSTSTNCSEKFIFAAPAIDANGLDAQPGAAVRHLLGVRRVAHPGLADLAQRARSRSPASTTGTTAASSRRTSPSPVIDLNSGTTSGACP